LRDTNLQRALESGDKAPIEANEIFLKLNVNIKPAVRSMMPYSSLWRENQINGKSKGQLA